MVDVYEVHSTLPSLVGCLEPPVPHRGVVSTISCNPPTAPEAGTIPTQLHTCREFGTLPRSQSPLG